MELHRKRFGRRLDYETRLYVMIMFLSLCMCMCRDVMCFFIMVSHIKNGMCCYCSVLCDEDVNAEHEIRMRALNFPNPCTDCAQNDTIAYDMLRKRK